MLRATDIVRFAVKPSLRPASCCRVVVRKGAYGRRVNGFDSTEVTWNSAAFSASASTCAWSSARCRTPLPVSRPSELKSLPVAIFAPDAVATLAENVRGSASAPASRMASMPA